jgi:hypothetical protein
MIFRELECVFGAVFVFYLIFPLTFWRHDIGMKFAVYGKNVYFCQGKK